MRLKIISCIMLVLIFLASCAPDTSIATLAAESPAAPTIASTSKSTLTSTQTSTPKPVSTVMSRAILTQWPDEAPCNSLEFIPGGTRVTVVGTYKDYAAVEIQQSDTLQTGYLPKIALDNVPENLVEYGAEEIPWKPLVDFSAWRYFSPENGGELIISPGSDNESDVVTDPSDHPVPVPLRIRFGMQVVSSSWASVKIFGLLDNHDPWWKDTTRMDVFLNGATYELCVRDGSTENCSADIILNLPQDQEITFLFLDNQGKRLQVLDSNEKLVQEIDFANYPGLRLPDGLFPEGVFHFGTSVGAPGELKVTHLSISTPPSGIYQASWMSEPGLAELAASKGIMIGFPLDIDKMLDDRYCKVIRHDFNLGILPVFSEARVWLSRDHYDFALLDQAVNSSADYGLPLYASHLVWGSYDAGVLPDWLKNGEYSKEDLLAILHDHITTLMTRYKDKVKIWSIANEAPERDRYAGADFWYDHIGPEYIEKSFQWAREADPNATLILNAANNESPRDQDTTYNIDTLYAMVKTMKENGVSIDAVGMQSHLYLPWSSHVLPQEADVEATMKRFGGLGVKVMITEMDVNLHEIQGTAQQKETIQQQLYSTMMTACIRSGVCTLFATWGVYDSESWIIYNNSQWIYQYPVPDAAPLLFDDNLDPKPAYFAVLEALKAVK
ncbi:MAG TPA: endo-1,4-beta-xylanase [Anaerolineaceae bacterium]|nr:endo-1,4-beta-xylanase [Anaerolineaceae bacterium]